MGAGAGVAGLAVRLCNRGVVNPSVRRGAADPAEPVPGCPVGPMADLIEDDLTFGRHRSGAVRGAYFPMAAFGGSAIGPLEDLLFTRRRLWGFGLALLFAYATVFGGHIWLRDWPVTASGPRFIDFVSFWINARFALTHAAAEAYQYAAFAAAQAPYVAVTRGDFPYFHLVYPPTLFPLVAPFGLLPFVAALAAWIVATGSLHLLAVRRILPHGVACVLALLPFAVAKNVWLG